MSKSNPFLKKPNLSLVNCQANRVGIGVTSCPEWNLEDHYGDRFGNDGRYTLCPVHSEMFISKMVGGNK